MEASSDLDDKYEAGCVFDEDCIGSDTLAKALWLEAAKSGNALAQITLAQYILDIENPSQRIVLFAGVLLTSAAQQGDLDSKLDVIAI